MRYLPLLFAPLWVLAFHSPARGDGGVPSTEPATALMTRRVAFFHHSIIDAYETVGRRNPKWDANAREVLTLAVRRWMAPLPDPDLDWQIMFFADKAYRAGCDDPMVLYYGLRAHMTLGVSCEKGLVLALNRTIRECKYAPFLKVVALVRLVDYARALTFSDAEAAELGKKLMQEATDNLPGMMAEPEFPPAEIAKLCVDLTDDGREYEGDRKPAIDRIYDIMVKAQPRSPVADLFKGSAYCNYAWDARGGSFAADVTETGWRLFGERLAVAKDACNAALDKDPSLAAAAAQMLEVQMGQNADRPEMEQYFQLAIAGDPDCYDAYDKKLYYLTPKWHGTAEDQLAFGRGCLATRRWSARIPFLLLQSQRNIAEGRFREICTDEDNKLARDKAWEQAFSELYKADPSMWEDVQKLYEGYFAYDPKAVADRIAYAQSAMTAGHLDIAVEQMLQVTANTDPAFHRLVYQPEPGSAIGTALFLRALGRQATDRAQEALSDLRQLCKLMNPENPQQWYYHLRIWLAQQQLGSKAQADRELADFVKTRAQTGAANWPPKIAAFFLGQLSEADFLAAADTSDPKQRQGNQCEAWYYAGKKRLLAGDSKTAAEDFSKCIATDKTDFAEYLSAQNELKALGK